MLLLPSALSLHIFCGTEGYLENIPVKDVKRFEKEFLEYVELKNPDILDKIRKEKALSDELIEDIKSTVEEFLGKFKISEKKI